MSCSCTCGGAVRTPVQNRKFRINHPPRTHSVAAVVDPSLLLVCYMSRNKIPRGLKVLCLFSPSFLIHIWQILGCVSALSDSICTSLPTAHLILRGALRRYDSRQVSCDGRQ